MIFPLIKEVYKSFSENYALWIQNSITYDEVLTGTPDYMLAKRSPLGKTVVGEPIVLMAEAKRNDFEEGWGQCLAEMYAAQKINNNTKLVLYGIVTDGKNWEFGKLVDDEFTKNIAPFSIVRLPELFGALTSVFSAACK